MARDLSSLKRWHAFAVVIMYVFVTNVRKERQFRGVFLEVSPLMWSSTTFSLITESTTNETLSNKQDGISIHLLKNTSDSKESKNEQRTITTTRQLLAPNLDQRLQQTRRSFVSDDHPYRDDYWNVLQQHSLHIFPNDDNVSLIPYQSEYTCSFGPGRGIEEDSGYKLLVEKVRHVDLQQNEENGVILPKLFCGLYTYSARREATRAQALSWGHQCDGFLAFSNESIPDVGIINLPHEGVESYNNMWMKTRSIWTYIHDHLLDEYDFFHLGGDDMYVLVDNLKMLLRVFDPNTAYHLGQWLPSKEMVSGGPGYTLSRQAVKTLVKDILPYCHPNKVISAEDKMISQCLQAHGTFANESDTRDSLTGEQTYHDASPALLYTLRGSAFRRGSSYQARNAYEWESQPHPSLPNQTVGPKYGLESVAEHSVSFHHIHSPQYVMRIHAILNPDTCPPESALGKALHLRRPQQVHLAKDA